MNAKTSGSGRATTTCPSIRSVGASGFSYARRWITATASQVNSTPTIVDTTQAPLLLSPVSDAGGKNAETTMKTTAPSATIPSHVMAARPQSHNVLFTLYSSGKTSL